MRFQVDVLFQGFSGRVLDYALGWGAFALVQDGKHNVLFDTGSAAVRGKLKKMLADRGLTPSDIDYVVISHLHYDHAYNLDLFPDAIFVVGEADWEYAVRTGTADPWIETKALSMLLQYQVRYVKEETEEILPGMSVMLTPGHTPGCITMVLDQGKEGMWMLAGDAVKNRLELESGEVALSEDPVLSRVSIRKIKERASRVLPGHDCWLTVKEGRIIPEGGNDVTLYFSKEMPVNCGQTEIKIHVD